MQMNLFNIVLELLTIFSILAALAVITSTNPVIAIIFLIALFLNVAIYLILLGLNFIGLSYLLVYIGAITVLVLFIVMMLNTELINTVEIGKNYSKLVPGAFLIASLFLILFSLSIPTFVLDFTYTNIYDFIAQIVLNINKFWLGNYNTNNELIKFLILFYNNQLLEMGGAPEYLQFLQNFEFWVPTEVENLFSCAEKYNSSYGVATELLIKNVNPAILLHKNLQIESIGQAIYGYYSIILIFASFLLLLAMITPILLTSNSKLNK